ncbi:DUF1093 domain-containing protein [Leuconostoc citreum]
MKKKIIIIISLVAIFVVFLVSLNIKNYVNSRYKSDTAFAKVPNEIPKLENVKDMNGKLVEGMKGYKYEFTFVTRAKKVKKISFEVKGEDNKVSPLKQNTYVTAQISEKLIVEGPQQISENKIPENVLIKINELVKGEGN